MSRCARQHGAQAVIAGSDAQVVSDGGCSVIGRAGQRGKGMYQQVFECALSPRVRQRFFHDRHTFKVNLGGTHVDNAPGMGAVVVIELAKPIRRVGQAGGE